MKRGKKGEKPRSRVLGQDLGCPVRDPSHGLGISPLLPAEDKLLLARVRCRAERWKAEGGGCEDQCIKHPCKSQLQGLKKSRSARKKTTFSVINLVIHQVTDIQMHRYMCICTQFISFKCLISPLLFTLTLRYSQILNTNHWNRQN